MQLQAQYHVILFLLLSIMLISYLFYRIYKVRRRLQIDENITLMPLHGIEYDSDYREKALRKLESTDISPDQIQRDYISEKIKHDLKEELKQNVNKYVKEYNENNLDLRQFLLVCLLLISAVWALNVYALIRAIDFMITNRHYFE